MKKQNLLLCVLFVAWIYGLFFGHIFLSDRAFSEMENRTLSSVPKFTTSKLFSGKYGAEVEVYLNDQFPFRDYFKKASTAFQYLSIKREIGGVYFAGDGLALHVKKEQQGRVQKNISSLLKLKSSDTPFYFALIPDAACVYGEKLPYGAPGLDQQEFISSLYNAVGENCIDISSGLFAHRNENIFYRTDHHWTSLGAYYGYSQMMHEMNIDPVPIENYQKLVLSRNFYGTLYSKAPAFWIKPDTIDAYVPDYGTTVTVFDGIKYQQRELYCLENLEKKDKYAVFLGGNQPLVVLDTKAENKPRLLVLRDSYFDSLSPFLQQDFSSIHLVDTRYYKNDILKYIKENEIDVVLACYSVDQFANVVNLSFVVPD